VYAWVNEQGIYDMPYTIRWYIDKHVLFVHYRMGSTPEEINAFLNELNSYARECEHPLMHVIMDLAQVIRGSNLVSLAKGFRNYTPHPKIGWVITVGEQNMSVRFSANIARQILRLRQRSCDRMPEALDFLKDIDSTIDWEKADNNALIYRPDDAAN
jgi:hypothetical protein